MAVDNNPPPGGNVEQPQVQQLSVEQIQQSFEANPDLQKQWISAFTQSEAGKTLLNNHLNTNKGILQKELVGQGFKKGVEIFEQTLEEVTGKKKPDGVKGTEWLKEVLDEKVNTSKEGDEVSQQLMQQLSDENKQLKQEVATTKKQASEQIFSTKVESGFKQAVSALSWKTDVPQDMLFGEFGAVNAAIQKFKSTAKQTEDGTVVYYKGDAIIINPATQKPATETEVLQMHFGKYITTPTAGGGAPVSSTAKGEDGKPIAGSDFDPSKYPNRQAAMAAFQKHLASLGIADRSKQHTAALSWLVANDSYKSMPMK